MRLAGALAVLLLVAVVASLELWPSRPAPQPAIQRRAATPAATTPMRPVAPVVPAPTTDNQHSAAVPDAPGAFSRRLRCVDARTVYRGLASADVLALLCGGKPLDALQVEMPLAEAGDLHAALFVAAFAREGPCGPVPSASFARHRANDIERAQASGAGPEALRRLDDLLAAEQRGPTAGERAACSQATEQLPKLEPVLRQPAAALGNPRDITRGDDVDAEIAFDRKLTAAGDPNGVEALADALLRKDAPASQAEAVTLLRTAAKNSAVAKTRLAVCLLEGCPTPAAEPDEARQLLTAAASAGELEALRRLSGETAVVAGPGAIDVPVAERYAWSEMLHRLQAWGCFGSTMFEVWTQSPQPVSPLAAMSPADADAAQARARELLAVQLDQTRAQLGCD